MNEELRSKLFNLFSDHAIKMVGEYLSMARKVTFLVGDDDFKTAEKILVLQGIVDDMLPEEWSGFHSKWKRHLIKNKIDRSVVTRSEGGQGWWADHVCSWRNLPGFYSILDPVSQSLRSNKLFVIDVPKELGDKILILGFVP